jgi:acetylornithine/succinyldiaminopimelate/putrescine aminotransferase
LANGSPIGLALANPQVAAELTGLTTSTFGGNPVTATAARVVLDFTEEYNLAPIASKQARTCAGDWKN